MSGNTNSSSKRALSDDANDSPSSPKRAKPAHNGSQDIQSLGADSLPEEADAEQGQTSQLYRQYKQAIQMKNGGVVNLELEEGLWDRIQDHYREEFFDEIKKTYDAEVRMEIQRDLRKEQALKSANQKKEAWEAKMLSKTRDCIKITKEGNDDIFGTFYAHPDHTKSALEIIRRGDPEAKLIKQCYVQKARENLELETPFLGADDKSRRMIRVMVRISEKHPLSYKDAVEASQEFDLESRRQVFRCIASHPYYKACEENKKQAIKQQLVQYFDRHFTTQVALLTDSELRSKKRNSLLRLGADDVFTAADGLGIPKSDKKTLAADNRATWEDIRFVDDDDDDEEEEEDSE